MKRKESKKRMDKQKKKRKRENIKRGIIRKGNK